MKLLKKTNRTYLAVSASAFIIGGLVLYIVLSMIFEEQLNENLKSDLNNIAIDIQKGGTLPEYYPFVEVRNGSGRIVKPETTIDTLIFDEDEKENIPFRQVSSVVTIKEQTYLIIVRDKLIEKSDLLLSISIVIGLLFILLVLGLNYINRKLASNIWQPFYDTLKNLREFSHTDSGIKPLTTTDIDEFRELNKTLENLTSRVITDYQSLKRFTEDASHEIQTPVSVIQSKLETLMQNTDLNKDQADLLKSSYSSVQRISRLTQTLLLLTKIANEQYPEKISVNLSELIEEKISFFELQCKEKSIVLRKEISKEFFLITNFFLAESMIMNLIGNAVKHSSNHGEIRIRLEENSFMISNTGQPLTVDSSKLFERFFKINKSSESHGLGLAIVKEICRVNNWIIGYEYSEGSHKFSVKF